MSTDLPAHDLTHGMVRSLALAFMVLVLPPATPALAEKLKPQVVVTAAREPESSLTLIGNTARVGQDRIDLVGATHVWQLGTQAAGTWLARGAEQESLPAIRSPVLTGPGSCGSFLMLEDGIPVRPAGFCNVNELFEILTEQSVAMEVVRGPTSSMYGASGLHGTLNFLLPEPGAGPGLTVAGELGPYHYWRSKLLWEGELGDDPVSGGFLFDHDSDFRANAGYHQAKGFLKRRHQAPSGDLEFSLSGTLLNQDSAGYITGYKSYENETLRTENLNPEGYRNADSQRFYTRWTPAADHPLAGSDLRLYLRHSRMDFLQHFLPGQPREKNGQFSGGAMFTTRTSLGAQRQLTTGVDVELASGYLEEFQDNDPGIGAIPPGQHYDYDVRSFMAAPFAQLDLPIARDWTLQLSLRAEYMLYDYDNNMLDGNTRDDGTACTPAPCRFSRPADSSDGFLNAAPGAGLLYVINPGLATYLKFSRGFRPPQATELYRLQAQQEKADLESETLDSVELGTHWQTGISRMELAAFYMTKRNAIFQDIARFNVNDGKTRHVGIELQADLRLESGFYGGFAGTYAKQTYDFDASTPGGENIVSGNEIDTAPRTLASARAGYETGPLLGEIEWVNVGRYYLDAGNLAEYGGHNLLNLRGVWRAGPDWSVTLRVNNLADKLYADRADYVNFPSANFPSANYRYFPGREREIYLEFDYRVY